MKEYIDKNTLIEELEEYIEFDTFDQYKEEPLINMSFEKLEDVIASQPTITEAEIRAKAIDEFVENISLEISESLIWGMIADCFKYKNMSDTSDKIVDYIIETSKKIAEQLKVGEHNE